MRSASRLGIDCDLGFEVSETLVIQGYQLGINPTSGD